METNDQIKKAKREGGSPRNAPIRVSKETRRRILVELSRLNKKNYGRKVKPSDLITLAITLLTAEHYAQLQDMTLSNADRLERRYQDYVKRHGPLAKDSFLGMLLGEDGAAKASDSSDPTTGETGLL